MWINLFYWVKTTLMPNKKFQGSVRIRCAFKFDKKKISIFWFQQYNWYTFWARVLKQIESERHFETSQSFFGLFHSNYWNQFDYADWCAFLMQSNQMRNFKIIFCAFILVGYLYWKINRFRCDFHKLDPIRQ